MIIVVLFTPKWENAGVSFNSKIAKGYMTTAISHPKCSWNKILTILFLQGGMYITPHPTLTLGRLVVSIKVKLWDFWR